MLNEALGSHPRWLHNTLVIMSSSHVRLQVILYTRQGAILPKQKKTKNPFPGVSLHFSIECKSGSLDSCGICLIWFPCSSNHWPCTPCVMAVLSSCEKKTCIWKNCKKYASQGDSFFSGTYLAPSEGLSGPSASQKNALQPLPWIISTNQCSASSILQYDLAPYEFSNPGT